MMKKLNEKQIFVGNKKPLENVYIHITYILMLNVYSIFLRKTEKEEHTY